MTKLKVVSISHSIDPDGLGSQAIIFRYFRELHIEPIGFLADYDNFAEILAEAMKEKPDVLIISDIGLNNSFIKKIIAPLREAKARKIWIDHHKTPEDLKEIISEVIDEFIHDTKVCAAELVQKRFMPDDEISKVIAQIGHNGDFDVNDKLSNIFYTLIDFHRFSMDNLVRIRELLVKGDFEDKELLEEYLEAYKVFEAERDQIRINLEKLEIAGKTVVYAYSNLLPRGKITKFLEEISDGDILMAIDTTNFRVGLRSETVDVARIAMYFDGGGHKHRSGFTYQNAITHDKKLAQDFIQALEKVISSI